MTASSSSSALFSTSTSSMSTVSTNAMAPFCTRFEPIDFSVLGDHFDQCGSMEECVRAMDANAVRRLVDL
jgi:hypothetical protein